MCGYRILSPFRKQVPESGLFAVVPADYPELAPAPALKAQTLIVSPVETPDRRRASVSTGPIGLKLSESTQRLDPVSAGGRSDRPGLLIRPKRAFLSPFWSNITEYHVVSTCWSARLGALWSVFSPSGAPPSAINRFLSCDTNSEPSPRHSGAISQSFEAIFGVCKPFELFARLVPSHHRPVSPPSGLL